MSGVGVRISRGSGCDNIMGQETEESAGEDVLLYSQPGRWLHTADTSV